MKLDNVKLECSDVIDIKKRLRSNSRISEYYQQMFEEDKEENYGCYSERLKQLSDNVKFCSDWWSTSYYRLQNVKDIKRINLCHNKFCSNCQNLISKKRQMKYTPYLDSLLPEHDIYHVVFTVANCSALELNSTITKMYKKFPYIIRYMNNTKKCKFFNFKKYGFFGSIRSFEITAHTNEQGYVEYHPHFHCLFVLAKGVQFDGKNINKFSFDKTDNPFKDKKYVFSDFEIMLQKMWYLFYNDIKFTKENVDNLTLGYSVKVLKPDERDYHEVFKYATKSILTEESELNRYDVFKTLYNSLRRKKMIQGYGKLNRFSFDDELDFNEIDALADEEYLQLVNSLNQFEDPIDDVVDSLDDVLRSFDIENGTKYISKNIVRCCIRSDFINKNDIE